MTFEYRDYQEQSIGQGINFFEKGLRNQLGQPKNGVIVIPTGGGKSVVIAGIASNLEGNTLVLQPSKEILRQNFNKTKAFGDSDFAPNLGVYSASFGLKQRRKITFATIGSVHKRPELFEHFDHIIFDECHGANAKGGMYKDFFAKIGKPVLGLTATPYRLHGATSFNNSQIKFITRTRPRVFDDIIHITQNKTLFDRNYLCPIEYIDEKGALDKLQYNSTGADFTDSSLREFADQGLRHRMVEIIAASSAKHILGFAPFIDDAIAISDALNALGINTAYVTGTTDGRVRDAILEGFQSGYYRAVINVGVLTTGFDFPELDMVVNGRPTNSLSLYYQITGRGIRIHPNKEKFTYVDLGGNIERFGRLENFEIVEPSPGMHRLKSEVGFLTGIDLVTRHDLEAARASAKPISQSLPSNDSKMKFGKYQGQCIKTVPIHYLTWVTKSFGDGWAKQTCEDEINRRRSMGVRI